MSSETCIVCLEDTTLNIKSIKNLIKICECQYWIHEICINAWIIKEPICPICKKIMIYENEEISVNNSINNNSINNNSINNNSINNNSINNKIVIRNSIITIIIVLTIVIILIFIIV
jgi:hypothetical protein